MKRNKVRIEDLPIFEITCDDDGTQGIRLVSLVKDPAIEVKGMYFNKEEAKDYAFKSVEDKQIVVGPAMIPNKKILRKDEDGNMYWVYFTPETIKQMVAKFNSENNNKSINVDHSNKMVNGFILSNWIVEDPTYDKSRYYGFNLPVGSWFIEVKIDDKEFWLNEIKDLGKYGFSIEGLMGQKLVEMTEQHFVVEPEAGESKNDFISRCISTEIKAGYDQDQAAAICYTKWDEKSYSNYDKVIDSLTDDELLGLFCTCGSDNFEFGGKPGLVHPNCECKLEGNEFILAPSRVGADGKTLYPCPLCEEAQSGWVNGGMFMDVFGKEYKSRYRMGTKRGPKGTQATKLEALKQGAISVSFDFDGTLTNPTVQQIVRNRIAKGEDCYVITKRTLDNEVMDLAQSLGIQSGHIYFTNHGPKWPYIKRLGIAIHYDDSIEEINEIEAKTDCKCVKVRTATFSKNKIKKFLIKNK